MSEEIPAHTLPLELDPEERETNCRFCGRMIRWGLTTKKRRAPFDAAAPHQNHWISCKAAKQARRRYPAKRA